MSLLATVYLATLIQTSDSVFEIINDGKRREKEEPANDGISFDNEWLTVIIRSVKHSVSL